LFLKERFLVYYNKPPGYRYAICLKEDNKPIGYVWLSDDENQDFAYRLRKEFWNHGIVTEHYTSQNPTLERKAPIYQRKFRQRTTMVW